MAASNPISSLPYLFPLLLLLQGISGAEGQELPQLQGQVLVLSGEDVKLGCLLSAFTLIPETAKWFVGKGPTQKLVYSASAPSVRVTRTNPGSNSDFSISIHNVVPADSGIYYCAKRRIISGGEVDLPSGGETEVVVIAPPKVRIETNPTSSVRLNESVTITCLVEGFHPNDTDLVWLENGREIDQRKADPAVQNADRTFTMKSALEVVATEQRSLSVFTCRLLRNSQPLVNVDLMLKVGMQPGEDGHSRYSESGSWEFSSLLVGLFVGKMAAALFLLYLFLRKERSQVCQVTQVGGADKGLS